MKKLSAIALAVASLVAALPAAQPAAGPDVRLVLLIAVDQFRYDYLTRFRSEYTDGIKRLLTEGAVFTNANLEHYPTVTAIGHATMLSGATPSVSGIIGNDWFDRETGKVVQSVSDLNVKPIGSPTASAASPRRLLVSTLGDELKMASLQPKGRRGRAARVRRVVEGSLGHPARRPRRRRGVLVGHEDRELRDEHVLRRRYSGLAADVQRQEAGGRAGRRVVDGSDVAVHLAAAVPGRTRSGPLRRGLRQPGRQRAAPQFCRRAPGPRAARQTQCDGSALGQLLVERLGRSQVRAGFAAGAGHRAENRPGDRASPGSRRQDHRASAHARRVHDRSRRRPGAGIAARSGPARRTHDDQGIVRPDSARARGKVRRRPSG